jgi:hypothetical protein
MFKKAVLVIALSMVLIPLKALADDNDSGDQSAVDTQEQQVIQQEAQQELQVTDQFLKNDKSSASKMQYARVPAGVENLSDELPQQ